MKYTFKQFQTEFPDDDACLDRIMDARYGFEVCPKCGVVSKLTRIQGRRAYACKEGCHIYPCAGTIFEHSSTSLSLWFHAMYLMTSTRNGVAAKELQRQLGVTYKCAWRMGHQLRALMGGHSGRKKHKHVEIDETYIGGKSNEIGRPTKTKAAVLGMLERGGDVVAKVVPDVKTKTIFPIIQKHVQKGSYISTDSWRAYKKLHNLGYRQGSVDHHKYEWKNGIYCTNGIEGFWAHLKKGIRSTHIHVSREYLQNYVDEFGFRYNNRHEPHAMLNRLVSLISVY
jgi:transposase